MDPSEKLTIETPEQIALEYPLAGLGSRALALMIDTLIQTIAAVAIILIVMLTAPDLGRTWESAGKWLQAIAWFLIFCLYWGYFAVFEMFWNGQTPGKRNARIRVINASGRPVTVFEAIARNFMRAIDSQGLYLVASIACAIDKKNRRLGDMVAGTVVIHEVEQQGDAYWYGRDRSATTPVLTHVVAKLSQQEFQLIEAFLNRRLDLPIERREKAAHEIAERVGAHLNIAPSERPSDEDFLEEISRQYRDTARY